MKTEILIFVIICFSAIFAAFPVCLKILSIFLLKVDETSISNCYPVFPKKNTKNLTHQREFETSDLRHKLYFIHIIFSMIDATLINF